MGGCILRGFVLAATATTPGTYDVKLDALQERQRSDTEKLMVYNVLDDEG